MTEIELLGGKYTVIHDNGRGLRALRYGEEWRNLVGDNLVMAMAHEIEELRERMEKAEGLLSDALALLDNVHCYGTEEYELISKFLYGDDDE